MKIGHEFTIAKNEIFKMQTNLLNGINLFHKDRAIFSTKKIMLTPHFFEREDIPKYKRNLLQNLQRNLTSYD